MSSVPNLSIVTRLRRCAVRLLFCSQLIAVATLVTHSLAGLAQPLSGNAGGGLVPATQRGLPRNDVSESPKMNVSFARDVLTRHRLEPRYDACPGRCGSLGAARNSTDVEINSAHTVGLSASYSGQHRLLQATSECRRGYYRSV
jgi:hypothetical protein